MFVFDAGKLQPFDILLVRFDGDESSEKIRKKCNSNYSHAVVYIGDNSFIEGNYPVVSLFSSHRYHFHSLDDVKVLRLKEKSYKKFDLKKAEDFIRTIAYCDYNMRLLISIVNRDLPDAVINRFNNDGTWTGGVVCTSLVTLPYYIGGIDISMTNEPYYAHFGYIENSAFFDEVTSEVFVEVEKVPSKESFDYFTSAETGSILETQSEIVKELNNMVSGIMQDIKNNLDQYFDSDINANDLLFTTWEDILPLISKMFASEKGKEIDQQIFDKIISSGYNNLWYQEVHRHHSFFFPFYHLVTNVSKGLPVQPIEHYEFAAKTLIKSRERMQKNEDIEFGNFTKIPTKSTHILLDMYHCWGDLLDSTIRQYDAICKEYSELVKYTPW